MKSVMTSGEAISVQEQAGNMNPDATMEEAVRHLLTQVEQAGDQENGRKFKQLLAKAESGRLHLAFCGHFSAGKSSLINKLCGHTLLPSSPIPTSANIVSIVDGEAGAGSFIGMNP